MKHFKNSILFFETLYLIAIIAGTYCVFRILAILLVKGII